MNESKKDYIIRMSKEISSLFPALENYELAYILSTIDLSWEYGRIEEREIHNNSN